MYNMFKRVFDLLVSIIAFLILFPFLLIIAVLIYVEDPGPVIFKQKRVGKKNKLFTIYKFRSMKLNTPNVATHLLTDSKSYITKIGRFIRKTSIDELPQLVNIIKGEMSFVGPRPSLDTQEDLNELRTQEGVDILKPGITGLAQISGRDELSIPDKVSFDKKYLEERTFFLDIKIIFLTFFKVLKSEGVKNE